MRPSILLAFASCSLFAQTAVFPGSVANTQTLSVASNRVGTTLAAPIGPSDSTLTVTSATGIAPPTVLTITDERIHVCSVSGNTFAVCTAGRGFDNSIAASHAALDKVEQHLTAGMWNQIVAEVIATQNVVASNTTAIAARALASDMAAANAQIAANTFSIGTKADATATTNALALKADATATTNALAGKANIGGSVETRALRVSKVKPSQNANYGNLIQNLAPSGTLQLANVTGAGNVVEMQIANIGDQTSSQDTNIQVIVDGTTRMTVPIGLFFLLHGENTSIQSDNLIIGKNTAVAGCGSDCEIGGWRRVNIPFTTSLVINLVNASTTAGGAVFTQVKWYEGAAPAGLYPAWQKVFHANTVTFTSVASLATIDALPLVTLATGQTGGLDSIQIMYFCTSTAQLTSMEGHPTLTGDGTAFVYGGTEDFFGGQYYFNRPISTTEQGGNYATFNGGAPYNGMRGYRFFHKNPFLFGTSLRVNFENGHTNEGSSAPPAILFESLVIYYTSS